MEKKCRVWKSNTYDLYNIVSKKVFRERVMKIIDGLLVAEDTFHNIHKDKVVKHADVNNIVSFPSALELEELMAVDHILTSNELFNLNLLKYGGSHYVVNIIIEREIQTKEHFIVHVSSYRKIIIKVSINNNNDGIDYIFSIPYVYENKRALTNVIDSAYGILVNLYKDYGH